MSSCFSLSGCCDYLVKLSPLFISTHVTRGLCKVLGYETLTHGTSFASYLSILKSGGDPRRGGQTTALTMSDSLGQAARNYFYVFRDSEITLAGLVDPTHVSDNTREKVGTAFLKSILRRIHPIYHTYYAYIAEYKKHSNSVVPKWVKVLNAIRAIFTPKIRFIYSLDEIRNNHHKGAIFERDVDYAMGLAYRTKEPLPSERIGLIGLLKHADKAHVIQHIKSQPGRVVMGVGQVALGIFLTYKGLGIFF